MEIGQINKNHCERKNCNNLCEHYCLDQTIIKVLHLPNKKDEIQTKVGDYAKVAFGWRPYLRPGPGV